MQTYLSQLADAGIAAGFTVDRFGQIGDDPLLGLTRTAAEAGADTRHIYLSAGIHGDEPAGPQALLELLEEKTLPAKHHYVICPLLNPVGLLQGIRENGEGLDLNRDYRHLASREIKAHVAWMAATLRRVSVAVHLHEDWESRGFYLYELNFTRQPGLSAQIMEAVQAHLPIETAEKIDGRRAKHGIIRPESIPHLEEGDPEAIYLQKNFGGLNYTVETPSSQNLAPRVKALKAAVLAVV